MSLESDMAVLRGVWLFEDLSDDQLRLLAFGAEHRRLRKGEIIFRAEARADAGFVVADGMVALHRGKPEDKSVAARIGRGGLLGELALLTETRRPGTAITETDSDLIRITRTLFRRMLEEYPEIAAALHGKIADQLDATIRDISRLESRFSD